MLSPAAAAAAAAAGWWWIGELPLPVASLHRLPIALLSLMLLVQLAMQLQALQGGELQQSSCKLATAGFQHSGFRLCTAEF
jgi:hypothetical protein